MSALLAAEVRKLWTARTTWVLTAIGLVLVILSSSTQVFGSAAGRLSAADRTAAAIADIGNNSLIVLVVALLVMTTEFRHRTIGRTLLLTPSRTRVLLAKLSVGALYAVAFFGAALVLVAGLVVLRSLLGGSELAVDGQAGRLAWQGLLAMVLTGIFGVAVGALVRSQVVAITGSLVWLMIVENLASALRPEVARWLPFQALNAVFIPGERVLLGADAGTPLPPGVALAVFLAYVLVAAVVAGALMTKRDV